MAAWDMSGGWHLGRSWEGHPIEDECPCEKAADEPVEIDLLAALQRSFDQARQRRQSPADNRTEQQQ